MEADRTAQTAFDEILATRAPDLYFFDELLRPEERELRTRLRDFCDREVVPTINGYWERAEFPLDLIRKLAGLGVIGGTIRGYGCPGLSAAGAGLAHMELERGDGSVNTFHGIQSGLAMGAIHAFGSEEQKERWLPAMASLDKIGAFGMTEPEHGSDAYRLETRAERKGSHYMLAGRKRWIGNAPVADVIVVWARDEDGHVGAYLVERDSPGLRTQVITGKTSKRAILQGDVFLENVRVPVENKLPGARTFRDVSEMLNAARHNVAWHAVGDALACYEIALGYVQSRRQFGKPIGAFQLVQEKLARMAAEITCMQLLCLRMSRLLEEGRLTAPVASIAKMNNAAKARAICLDARDILGGNGILLEYHVARHVADIEAVFTYEGTDHMQALIVGRELTGISAFA